MSSMISIITKDPKMQIRCVSFMFSILIVMAAICTPILIDNAFANNLQVSNGSVVSQNTAAKTASIQFDVIWDNSWRDFTNYDAVWVFIKYSTDSGSTWHHGLMKGTGLNPGGFSSGAGASIEEYVPPDGVGVFVQRSTNASGRVDNKGLTIVWDYGIDGVSDAAVKDVWLKIFAIEMVYIPQGAFYVGDNDTSTASLKQGSADVDPWYIQNENAITTQNAPTNVAYYVSGGNAGEEASGAEFIIGASFPKGYAAFYIMKYEITQGQYADFLNTLSSTQATNRLPGQNGNNRHTISGVYPNYSAGRADRACNYLSWMDLCAYAAWAGLRPMTEFEFEKAARGKDIFPIDGELPWGNTTITDATMLSLTEDGSEKATNSGANCSYNNINLSGGDGGTGPVRAGIFATATSTREQAGAGYYGVLELAGNVWERCATIGNSAGRAFLASHGTGALTADGSAANPDWPGYAGTGVTAATGSGFRGGSWAQTTVGRMAVSDRSRAAYSDSSRGADYGGRCVRTAS